MPLFLNEILDAINDGLQVHIEEWVQSRDIFDLKHPNIHFMNCTGCWCLTQWQHKLLLEDFLKNWYVLGLATAQCSPKSSFHSYKVTHFTKTEH